MLSDQIVIIVTQWNDVWCSCDGLRVKTGIRVLSNWVIPYSTNAR